MRVGVEHVYKRFGTQQVLKDCCLEVESGETLVIIGQSGVGKSVLLKHIAGLIEPDQGQVRIDGQIRREMSEDQQYEVALKMGFLFQGAALFDSMTVGENVTFALKRYRSLSQAELRRVADERLEWVGLAGIQDKKPAELSGGMRKRVGLARAIAMDPALILYDEPTTGLDPIMADAINDLIIGLQSRLKMTAVAVTHDMASAYKIADRIAMIYQGAIIEIGGVEAVKNSGNAVVQQFIHGSAQGPIQAL